MNTRNGKIYFNLPFSKGEYNFDCKSTFKLAMIIFQILQNIKTDTVKLATDCYIKLIGCLWIVYHVKNKLEGINSVSSSVCDNAFCKARQALQGCICSKCYASNQQSYQKGLKEHNIINGLILRNILIPVKYFKLLPFNSNIIRIESFGDVQNVTQARNYIRIIKAFPQKRFAIWSKNIAIWNKAFAIEGKPKNTTYVHSSSYINKVDNIDTEKYSFVDHVFTVFTEKYTKENNIVINCGGKKCMQCILKKTNCYFRNTVFYINELLK